MVGTYKSVVLQNNVIGGWSCFWNMSPWSHQGIKNTIGEFVLRYSIQLPTTTVNVIKNFATVMEDAKTAAITAASKAKIIFDSIF